MSGGKHIVHNAFIQLVVDLKDAAIPKNKIGEKKYNHDQNSGPPERDPVQPQEEPVDLFAYCRFFIRSEQ